jgi:hypothetical protein
MELSKEEIIDDDFLNTLIYELTTKPEDRPNPLNFDLSKVNYNHYFTDNAEEIIKNRLNVNQNDPYINLVIDKQVEEIKEKNKSNLEDWVDRGFINNTKTDERTINYITYDI